MKLKRTKEGKKSFQPQALSHRSPKVTICGRHIMASVRDVKIAEALLMLCLAYYVMKEFGIAEVKVLWHSRIEIWGARFSLYFP